MSTELKMDTVFKSKLQPEHLRVKSTPVRKSCDDSVKSHEAICHAVNNHDRLVEELEQLRKERDDLKDFIQSTRDQLSQRSEVSPSEIAFLVASCTCKLAKLNQD